MRFAFLCSYTPSLCWARRLLEEGHDVLVYLKGDVKNRSGEGIVPKTHNMAEWLAWGAQDPMTIYFFDMTSNGELADRLAKSGKYVVNGGSFQDRLEFDRAWGEELAKSVGILCPPTKEFSTISAAIDFLKSNPKQECGDGGWAFKVSKDIGCDTTLVAKDTQRILDHMEHVRSRFHDNLKCIIQEKIDGVAVSTARWWNGRAWVGPYEGTIENKKLMNDNLGPSTGCSFCVVWFYETTPKIAEDLHWEELAGIFIKNKALPGLYDINAIVNDKGAWFLEWTPRMGIDSEIASQRGIKELGTFLQHLVLGLDVESLFDRRKSYFDITLSVPPYFIHECPKGYESPAVGVPIKGVDGLTEGNFVMGGIFFDTKTQCFKVGEPTGNLGYLVMAGTSLKKSMESLYDWCKEHLVVPDLQYRTDAVKVLQKDLDEYKAFGYETTSFLRR